MERLTAFIGIFTLLGIAVLLSDNRKAINLKTVLSGIGLQFFLAFFILGTPFGEPIFRSLDNAITTLVSFSYSGSTFLLQSSEYGSVHPSLENFAFRILPTIIFFSSIVSVLYHFGIIQRIVKVFAKIFQKMMFVSGTESLSVSANIFLGQTEAPLMVRPFIDKMTKSELMAVMTGGFATAAGGILAMYVIWLSNIPGIAGHLLTASVMSAPAALVIAKIIYPEVEKSDTMGDLNVDIEQTTTNAMEALGNGATDGLRLAANIAAMLIAFVALISLINYMLIMFQLTPLTKNGLF